MITIPAIRQSCMALALLGALGLPAQAQAVKNIVLVHGAWADGSSWSKIIPLLVAKGLHVTAVQLPLTSLADDVATVKRALALETGPTVLVGHSYGGAVITEAGNDPKVAALVYVAAFAPDAGQSVGSTSATLPPAPMSSEAKPDAQGFLKISQKGISEDFAQDLSPGEKLQLYVAQGPTNAKAFGDKISTPAWRSKPSWFAVAAKDRAIPPALEAGFAKAMHAKTTVLQGSHLIMLSQAPAVAAVIEDAASH